ncbi:MAG: hypothetical protein R2853_09010 [Thermomicrobiales bacterium]
MADIVQFISCDVITVCNARDHRTVWQARSIGLGSLPQHQPAGDGAGMQHEGRGDARCLPRPEAAHASPDSGASFRQGATRGDDYTVAGRVPSGGLLYWQKFAEQWPEQHLCALAWVQALPLSRQHVP